MSIEMIGGVYCPLSPQDPQHRLYALLQQIQTHLVFIDHLTKTKFTNDIISLDIDSIFINEYIANGSNIDQLSNVIVTTENIAYVIFTSGSTGTPKAVSFLILP